MHIVQNTLHRLLLDFKALRAQITQKCSEVLSIPTQAMKILRYYSFFFILKCLTFCDINIINEKVSLLYGCSATTHRLSLLFPLFFHTISLYICLSFLSLSSLSSSLSFLFVFCFCPIRRPSCSAVSSNMLLVLSFLPSLAPGPCLTFWAFPPHHFIVLICLFNFHLGQWVG